MSHTARRLVIIASAVLATTLAACTNPVAPSGPRNLPVPSERPSGDGVYMGSVG
jgi:hypothetical protein